MIIKKGYRLLITPAFYDWYRQAEDEPGPEYFNVGDVAIVLKRDDDVYWLLQSVDNARYGNAILQLAPDGVVNEMRTAYLNRNKVSP